MKKVKSTSLVMVMASLAVLAGLLFSAGCGEIQSKVIIDYNPTTNVLHYERQGDISVNDFSISKDANDVITVAFTQAVSEDKALIKSLETVQKLSDNFLQLVVPASTTLK